MTTLGFARHCRLFFLLLLAFGAFSCSRFEPPQLNLPSSQWLVVPPAQPETMRTNTRDIRGWFLTATTIRQNPRAAQLFAQSLTQDLARLDYVNLFSTVDLKYYFARKEDRLREAYPYLTEDEVASLMGNVPPMEFARELKADKMLTGRILESYMGEHRTFHWWWSKVDIELQVVDVMSGEIEWSKRYEEKDFFSSMKTVQDKISERVAIDLAREYFMPRAEGPGSNPAGI